MFNANIRYNSTSLDENFKVDPVNNNRFNKAIYLLVCCSILYKIERDV